MNRFVFTLLILLLIQSAIYAQCAYSGKYCISNEYEGGNPYTLYSFSREGIQIKAKYFAQNAFSQYEAWRTSKTILLATAGAFSDKLRNESGEKTPIGLCVDNGKIVSRMPNQEMDGMVIVYNGGAQIGGIGVVDMDVSPVRTGAGSFYPRTSGDDRTNFLNWGQTNGLTLFQTQLLYSQDRSINFLTSTLTLGSRRERRFLAICQKGGVFHHIVVDAPKELELNLTARNAKNILDRKGYTVMYILNLDTGDYNILYALMNGKLTDQKPSLKPSLSEATNLLVYYVD